MSNQNSSEEGMNIDEQPLLSSQELEDRLLNINLVERPYIRVINKPWAKWADCDKHIMMDHINYHIAFIEYINNCWASGPTIKKPPQKPESDVEKLVKKDRKRKAEEESSILEASQKKLHKIKPAVFNQMNNVEFNEYLQGKLIKDYETDAIPVETNSSDLESMANNLNDLHAKVKEGDLTSLRNNLELEKALNWHKKRFDILKIKFKIKKTWADWISENTTISEAYARQHKVM